MRKTAFSLVELVIVIVIIGVIAAIAVPRVSRAAIGAKEASLRATVRNIASQVQLYYAEEGTYPGDIDPAWFSSGKISNPYNPDHPTPVFLSPNPADQHPIWKIIRGGSTFWYNPASGIFRGRVDDTLSNPETIALYNRVNNTNVTSITQRN